MNATSARPTVPWRSSDATTAFITTAVGVGLAFIAWWGSSGTGRLDHQVTWTVVAIIGVMVLGLGNFAWLLNGRRAVALRRTNLVEELEGVASQLGARAAPSFDRAFVRVRGSGRYHDEACQLVRGKEADRLPADAPELEHLRPCEMCQA